jgi:DNA-binding transcriptional regulator YiaG
VSAPGRLGEHARAAGLRVVRPWEAEEPGGRFAKRKKGEPPPPPKREQAGRCPSCQQEKSWLRPGEVCAPCRVGRTAVAPLRLDEDDGPAIAPRPVPPRLVAAARVIEPAPPPVAVEPAPESEQSEEVEVAVAEAREDEQDQGVELTCPVCKRKFLQNTQGKPKKYCSSSCTNRAARQRFKGKPIDAPKPMPAAGWIDGLTVEAITAWREQHNVSKARLAALVGVSSVAVGFWEAGKSIPQAETQTRLRELLDGPAPAFARPSSPEPEAWGEGLSAEVLRGYRETHELSRGEMGILLGASGGAVEAWERGRRAPLREYQDRLRDLIAGPPPKRPLRGPDAPAPTPEPEAEVAPAPEPAPALPAPRPSLRRAALGALAAFARAAAGRLVAIGTAAEEASR